MSGRVGVVIGLVDLALGLAFAECAGLALVTRRSGRGPRPADLAGNLLAGLCLMAAVRVALSKRAAGPGVPVLIAAAGLAHADDLRRRWRG